MKRIAIILFILVFSVLSLHAQKVSNADWYEKGQKIYVTYSLDKEADIVLLISIDGADFQTVSTTHLSGDVGMNVKSGAKKLIIWDVLKDRGELVGAIQFRVLSTESHNAYLKRTKQEAKTQKRTASYDSYASLCDAFYSIAGKADVSFLEFGVGLSLKSQVGVPISGSAFTFRYKMLEIAPAYFTYDFISLFKKSDTETHQFYWKPQLRLVVPVAKSWAFVPSIGYSWNLKNSDKWFLTKIHIRYYWLETSSCYFDFFAGYEDRGFAIGASVSYALPINL